ncbi:hypothetical protein YB2330_001884 [Saitoella coloradoensis]
MSFASSTSTKRAAAPSPLHVVSTIAPSKDSHSGNTTNTVMLTVTSPTRIAFSLKSAPLPSPTQLLSSRSLGLATTPPRSVRFAHQTFLTPPSSPQTKAQKRLAAAVSAEKLAKRKSILQTGAADLPLEKAIDDIMLGPSSRRRPIMPPKSATFPLCSGAGPVYQGRAERTGRVPEIPSPCASSPTIRGSWSSTASTLWDVPYTTPVSPTRVTLAEPLMITSAPSPKPAFGEGGEKFGPTWFSPSPDACSMGGLIGLGISGVPGLPAMPEPVKAKSLYASQKGSMTSLQSFTMAR